MFLRIGVCSVALLLGGVAVAQERAPVPPRPGTASIIGVAQVLSGGQPTPVRRARVFIRENGGAVFTTDTDTQGRFRVDQLLPGSYRVEIDKPGFVPISRVPALELLEAQQARVTVSMQRGAAIEGRITMQDGEPAAGLNVSAVRLGFGPYGKKPVSVRQVVSDDLGRFRIHTLTPGDYYIQAAMDPLRMLEIRNPGVMAMWTYYSGTPRLNEARVVTVLPEQQLSNITFTLMTATQAVLFGTVVNSSGQPPASFSVRVQRVGGAPGEVRCLLTGLASGASKQQTFQCPNIPPGEFWVIASSRAAAGGGVEFGARRISVDGQNIEDFAIATAPGIPVSGRVEIEGGGSLPAGVQISALETEYEYPAPVAGGTSSAATPPVSSGADGSFVFAGLAGARLFRLERLPADWALKGVWIDSVEVTDTPVTASSERPSTLRIVATSATASIDGTVTQADRQPARARMVVVFSEDERRWGARSRFVRMIETDANGHYLVRGLLPGEYRVAFVDPLADGAWEDPDLLASLRPVAAKASVRANERVTVDGRVR